MAALTERLQAMSMVKKRLILLIAGGFLFVVDYVEPAKHRQFIMGTIPLWGFGVLGAAIGALVIIIGLVRRR